ncbi:hypothetical protein WDU94_014612 [Cyamophila willieti]
MEAGAGPTVEAVDYKGSHQASVYLDNVIISCKNKKTNLLQRVSNFIRQRKSRASSYEVSRSTSQQQMKGPQPKRIKLDTVGRGKTTDSNEDLRNNRQMRLRDWIENEKKNQDKPRIKSEHAKHEYNPNCIFCNPQKEDEK